MFEKRQIHTGSVKDESFLHHPVIPGDQRGFVPDKFGGAPGMGTAAFELLALDLGFYLLACYQDGPNQVTAPSPLGFEAGACRLHTG
jgi:hypothetical protein